MSSRMAKLLYIESSPRKERAKSIQVARRFLDAYFYSNPSDTLETLDLWTVPLPEFRDEILNAKYRLFHKEKATSTETEAWKQIEDLFQQFTSADKLLFSIPMWNFGLPYKLKHYIDIITQPGYAFALDAETGTYTGLVTFKPALVIYARGGSYQDARASLDFQSSYFDMWLKFIGFTAINTVFVEPTLGAPDVVRAAHDKAVAEVEALAPQF